jgi:hypothetical protein
MLVPELYRNIEKEKGRPLTEIGASGVAFTRKDLLTALEFLRGSQVGVLGGDVLEIVSGKLRYTHDSWHVSRRDQENMTAFLNRSVQETEKYVNSYPDPNNGTIFYSPVISELGVVGSSR